MAQARTQTSTQIRNMYSEGLSFLNIRFYNTNLSFQFSPYVQSDPTGRSFFDQKNSQQTTVGYEAAFALYKTCDEVISGKLTEATITIPCSGGASLVLHHGPGQDGRPESIFSITKGGVTIPFRFKTHEQQVMENGLMTTNIIHSGLGAFQKTIEGYLTGINADRHLDKLTEEYAALQQKNQQGQGGQPQYQQQKQQWNNGGGYRKQYPPKQQPQQWKPPQQQNMSTYQIPN